MNNKSKAILYMLFSSFCFALMGALVKLAGNVPTLEKTFFRNLISTFIAAYLVIKNKKNFFGKKENQKYLLLRSILGTIGMIGYFYSIDHLLLSDSAMLNKLNPFFVTIFALYFLKEKPTPVQIPSLILAFLGALFIIKPQFDIQVIPAFIGFLSAIFAGGAYTMVRLLGDKEEFYTIVFYFSFASSLIMFPLMLINFKMLTLNQFLILIATGIVASLAQFSLTIAYKLAPAGEISIYNYTNVIFSGILGLILWKEIPDFLSFIGYILIISSGFAIYIYNKKCL
ncbi:DMT family transporter [Tepidibacter thalassicus]|uniref:EamA domain-containing membrane protein RarD n=1 Tax=Tepidibacter thalassicus DSM 15285 TaxID=1123350 RepID=A0A1M5S9U4_9FIRM|nr:DMT family transporter [Tepidibacter thalassicus]SHH35251.1 EamA domain-containing membrane protein RarD [Tepidibacter thalassicus DSM 15285]